jgi:hypothetical protein
MEKRSLAVFTAFCFVLSSWNCTISKKVFVTPRDIASKKNVTNILAVVKTSGERIDFRKPGLGRLFENEIIGLSGKVEQVEFPKKNASGSLRSPYAQVTYAQGQREFALLRKVREDKAAVVYEQIPRVHVPLAEIERILMKKTDGAMTALVTIAGIGAVVTVVAAIALSSMRWRMPGPWLMQEGGGGR